MESNDAKVDFMLAGQILCPAAASIFAAILLFHQLFTS
jgi:hypothetical protein